MDEEKLDEYRLNYNLKNIARKNRRYKYLIKQIFIRC